MQALLPFPSVLDMMNSDMNWTTQIGNAFLAQQQDVMDAVQRQRAIAERYGYLRSNGQIVVSGGPYITIMPVNPGFIVVPYYDPAVVFFAPRPGFVVGGAIRFGFGDHHRRVFRAVGMGRRAGSASTGAHTPCSSTTRAGAGPGRTAASYVHPYPAVHRPAPGARRPAEAHALHPRSAPERNAARQGRAAPREEHRGR